ncbi:MAG: hypothetical protein ACTHKV_01455 [Flavipsychrobacter sp.]
MDKIILSEEQLQHLRKFINSRGFKDELVVNEILDHFACKVEEELAKDTRIDLQHAMQNAHRSFGTLGFYVIQANFEKNTRRRYRRLYWQSMKSVLTSIPYLLLSIGLWWGIYKFSLWAAANDYYDFFDQNYASDIVMFGIFGGMIYTLIRYKPHDNYYYQIARQTSLWYIPVWTGIITGNNGHTHIHAHAIFTASVATICFVLLVVQCRILDAAAIDYRVFKQLNAE